MRLSDLYGAAVRDRDGRRFGRLLEIYVDGDRVEAIGCGAASLLGRLTGRGEGRKIPWESVRRIDRQGIVVDAATRPAASAGDPARGGG
jgi:sporulation protein YlmC with PRC-barrel domain